MSYIPETFARKIRNAKRNRSKRLILSDWSRHDTLGSFPKEILEMEQLEELDLSHNSITSVPSNLGRLKNLASLSLRDNKLSSIPKSLVEIPNLRYLDVSYNSLTSFPALESDLPSMIELDLGANALRSIPSFVSRLPNLTKLYLYENQLDHIPKWLTTLTKLEGLHLADNSFREIPKSLFRIESLRIVKFDNRVTKGNRIREIPSLITQLGNLNVFDVAHNPIEIPSPEIVANGIQAIKAYFNQIEEQGKDYLHEAKLLILGESGSGKTTLAKKIQNPQYELRDEDSTKGIEVIKWAFEMENGQPFTVNIWDFGGQEIYHATHQFFLTKRSLYALVTDTRKEDTDFYFWLNVVELLSDNSPLLIVKNERQNRRREINERQLRGQFTNLRETFATNLATNRGLSRLLGAIKHHIGGLPHIGTPLPKTWVRVREALEKESRDYITLEEYLDICEQNGFTETKDKLQLGSYLHNLGVCLHFQEDPLLKKTVILKPKWGTDAVYKILDDDVVIRNLGRFDESHLMSIWRDKEYANMHAELLQLMINFQLCYKIPGGDYYIAPHLLTENQPKYDWDERNNLIVRYTYEFMPRGIITQFIVAMHTFIAEQKNVWKSGTILEYDGTNAEVIEHYGRREIKVRIQGKRKKELMAIVTFELEKIHASYKALKYTKLIPCNCRMCKDTQDPNFYRFETLRRFIDNNQNTIMCEQSFENVKVKTLIDDSLEEDDELLGPRGRASLPSLGSRNQVFISYSHRDSEWLIKLQTMLAPLVRNRKLSIWSDQELEPGARWKETIDEALASARVAVLLVSPDFLASDFIVQHELTPLLNKAQRRGVKIFWIAISDSLYKSTEIAHYQAANDPSKPLDTLAPPQVNQALVRISEKILEAAK